MSKVDQLLGQFTANGSDTKDKILGAAFVVTDKNGTSIEKYHVTSVLLLTVT